MVGSLVLAGLGLIIVTIRQFLKKYGAKHLIRNIKNFFVNNELPLPVGDGLVIEGAQGAKFTLSKVDNTEADGSYLCRVELLDGTAHSFNYVKSGDSVRVYDGTKRKCYSNKTTKKAQEMASFLREFREIRYYLLVEIKEA